MRGNLAFSLSCRFKRSSAFRLISTSRSTSLHVLCLHRVEVQYSACAGLGLSAELRLVTLHNSEHDFSRVSLDYLPIAFVTVGLCARCSQPLIRG